MIADAGDSAGTSADDEKSEIQDYVGGDGTSADGESPTVDGDVVASKRRRLTCSMESVEDKQEKMDDKNCDTSAGTVQLSMMAEMLITVITTVQRNLTHGCITTV